MRCVPGVYVVVASVGSDVDTKNKDIRSRFDVLVACMIIVDVRGAVRTAMHRIKRVVGAESQVDMIRQAVESGRVSQYLYRPVVGVVVK